MGTVRQEKGVSLVEMAVIMVIIGLIIVAVVVGKNTMHSAQIMKAYQQVVVPCVASVADSIRNGASSHFSHIADITIHGSKLGCEFSSSFGLVIDQVTITAAPVDLQAIMKTQLDNGLDTTVTENVVRLYVPK